MPREDDINVREEPPTLQELTSDGEGVGLEAEKDEGAIHAPFDPEKIDVITQARTVDLLLTRLREGELDLSPEFQRRSNVWDDARKSGLIESMLLRIPIPSLYVSEDKEGKYTVVDGLQRLCAISHFVDVAALNKAVKVSLDPLRLQRLESLGEYIGFSFVELPRPLQRRISETELTPFPEKDVLAADRLCPKQFSTSAGWLTTVVDEHFVEWPATLFRQRSSAEWSQVLRK